MAQMIPREISHLNNPSNGEKSVFRAINAKTPPEWICYSKRKISNGNEPDFLLIGPDLGILVLEEKGISIDMINNSNSESWTILRDSIKSEEKNPERQARDYVIHAVDLVKKVSLLRNKYGKLKFPYGHGVIFSNITRQQFNEIDLFKEPLSNSFNEQLTICKDEIPKVNENGKEFIDRIKRMTKYFKFDKLNNDDIVAIRYAIFPSSRVRCIGDWLNDKKAQLFTLTVEQEQIASGIGKNDKVPHRIIKGVAGSGKTIILRARAMEIAKQNPDWKVLLTFFTRSLQGYMETDMPSNVEVASLGRILYKLWSKSELNNRLFNPEGERRYENVINAFNSGELKKGIYDAIFLDEAQDMTPTEANIISSLLNPTTNCVMFAGDEAQNIFNNKYVNWKEHGFKFQGRSSKKEFSINYRNTSEIYEFASRYYINGNTTNEYGKEDEVYFNGDYYKFISFKRKGPCVNLRKFDTQVQECNFVISEVKRLLNQENLNPKDIAILHPHATLHGQSSHLFLNYINAINNSRIPYFWISRNNDTKIEYNPDINRVAICTPESAKGLEWEVVFTPSINKYYSEKEKVLAFVATTRARNLLYPSELTC